MAFKRLCGILLGTTIGAVCGTQPVFAQAQVPASAQSGIDDIVVTARRTSESSQTVPVTVSAFNAETLRDANIKETQDLMYAVPGVYLTGAGSKENAVYSIRGQGRPVAGPGQPGVVTYIAEVPLPNFGSSSLTYDLSSVQVLKGPQGTLFGRNTTGGAILLYPAKPTYEVEGYVQGTYGNYDYKDLEGALNLPIVDGKVALRVAGRLSRRDGYTTNLGTGGDPDDIHSDQVRVSLRLDPADAIQNVTYFDYRRTDQAGSGQVLVKVTPLAALYGIDALLQADLSAQRARGPRVVDYGGFQVRSDQKQIALVNRTEIDLGAATLVNLFGYQTLEWIYDANTDALPEPVGLLDAINVYHDRIVSDEVQLRGNAFGDKLEWLVGGFYYKKDNNGLNGSIFPQFFGLFPGNFSYNYTTEHSRAIFGNVKYKLDSLANGLSVNVGLRHTWDKQFLCGGSGESTPPFTIRRQNCATDNPVFVAGTGAELTSRSKALTWTLGIDWQATDDIFLYATTRRGYRAGGLNAPALGAGLAGQQVFQPEKVTDFEIGVKSNWQAGGVTGRLNIAGFITKSKATQYALTGVSTQAGCVANNPVFGQPPFSPDGDCNPTNDPAQTVLLINLGDTTIRGIEAEAVISPTPALRIGVRGTILDNSTDKFTLPAILAANYAGITDGKIPLNFTAKKTLNADVRYDLPVADSVGKVSVNASHMELK